MLRPPIALQTFTIRKELTTPAARAAAFRKLKGLGINNIELARVTFSPAIIKEIAGICRAEGLTVLCTQMKYKEISADLNQTIRIHRDLECPRCSVSVVSFRHLRQGRKGLKEYAEILNSTGKILKKAGISLLYHHHNYEFVPIEQLDGFRFLAESLDPDLVGLILDTYWLQRSGHAPADIIRRYAGRVKGVHLRDFTLTPPLWNPGITDTELGRGNLDFGKIIDSCAETGVEYMAIEQASSTPWRSIENSLSHLKTLGIDLGDGGEYYKK